MIPTQNFNNDYILHADLQYAIMLVGESDYGSNVVVPYGFKLTVSAYNTHEIPKISSYVIITFCD